MHSVKSKKYLLRLIVCFIILSVGIFFWWKLAGKENSHVKTNAASGKIISGSFDTSQFKTEEEWKKVLNANQYHILREAGTEIPFSGPLDYETRKGTYFSAGCHEAVFRSEQKYDSHTGWPSFWNPINPDALVLQVDKGLPGEPRIEVLDKCGNHLGHVFDDGPPPTGKRYCMNSLALEFEPDKNQ